MGSTSAFLERVTSNRGLPLRFFDNEQDAREWLGVVPE